MGLLDIASGNSFWRGYDYCKDGKVISCNQTGEYRYEGNVAGSADNEYAVMIDIEHPKRSTCTCPHAEGTRRVCKHKVALFFSVFPEEADRALRKLRNGRQTKKKGGKRNIRD